jgi:hypothetical protein
VARKRRCAVDKQWGTLLSGNGCYRHIFAEELTVTIGKMIHPTSTWATMTAAPFVMNKAKTFAPEHMLPILRKP